MIVLAILGPVSCGPVACPGAPGIIRRGWPRPLQRATASCLGKFDIMALPSDKSVQRVFSGDGVFDYNSMHASIATLRQKQIFFVGGSPKSGTTWLQLLLDAHPSVSCSGEGRFPSLLWSDLKQALDHYDRAIETDNKELFNELEEYKRLTQEDIYYIFASCIAVLLLKQSKHKLARAIGDKTPANVRAFAGLAGHRSRG
jgi:Sulfotransferase family